MRAGSTGYSGIMIEYASRIPVTIRGPFSLMTIGEVVQGLHQEPWPVWIPRRRRETFDLFLFRPRQVLHRRPLSISPRFPACPDSWRRLSLCEYFTCKTLHTWESI